MMQVALGSLLIVVTDYCPHTTAAQPLQLGCSEHGKSTKIVGEIPKGNEGF